MSSRRLVAALALVLCLATIVLGLITLISHFPRGLFVLGCVVVALVAGYYAVLHRGAVRIIGLAIAVAGLAGAVVLLVSRDLGLTVAIVLVAAASIPAARGAFGGRASLPPAEAPSRPVMFYNPRSGGGKAERFRLADEARRRGIEPIELTFERPLESLVQEALERGADGLAMAGGDGSQAVVAAAAARAGVPYACIPSGTRNHFALDLGVDREDVVGALDAFVDGVERRVDLAEVNGRVFVNNVSLGVYAEAVQSAGYRDAKLRTLLDTVPEVARPSAHAPALRWVGSEGTSHEGGLAVLISNNPDRLGRMIAAGTRPRMDTGSLGVAVIGPTGGAGAQLMRMWSERSVQVQADGSVPAGIDGEAAMLDAPVRFESRPRALQVRIARAHPGQSPSAELPPHAHGVVAALVRIALGRSDRAASDDRDDRPRSD
jgi:diacylglycerol kinase family enzyme